MLSLVAIFLITFIALFFFWTEPLLLLIILLGLFLYKHLKHPLAHEMKLFMILVSGGGVVEIVMVNLTQAWVYQKPDFFGIPTFMPILWGLLGVSLLSLYQKLEKK